MHLVGSSLQSQIFKTPSWPQPNILNRASYSASQDFPDGPAVKTLWVFPEGPGIKTLQVFPGGPVIDCTSSAGVMGLILAWVADIPHAAWHSQEKNPVSRSDLQPNKLWWCLFSDFAHTALFLSSEPVKLLSHVRLFAIPWTVAYQAPPSMEFSRLEYWSGLPFPSPGDLPNPGIEPRSPTLQADALPSELLGKPLFLSTD